MKVLFAISIESPSTNFQITISAEITPQKHFECIAFKLYGDWVESHIPLAVFTAQYVPPADRCQDRAPRDHNTFRCSPNGAPIQRSLKDDIVPFGRLYRRARNLFLSIR